MAGIGHNQRPVRAILRHHKWGISVLCPIGHSIECYVFRDRVWAGSAFAVEVGDWQVGRPNPFDRAAARCNGAGHELRCEPI